MILWLILFLLIIAISFILALLSMRDYQEIPEKSQEEYGLFLIRQTENFNAKFLDAIREFMPAKGLIISIERLLKGNKAALTIFGPKMILQKFINELNLLELEDYVSDLETAGVSVWEVGVKTANKPDMENLNNIFKNLPALTDEDQFFWQVILMQGEGLSFQTQIRAAVYSKEPARRQKLASILQNLNAGELIKVPRPFSEEQMINFYRLRSLSKDNKGPVLTSEGTVRLLKIS